MYICIMQIRYVVKLMLPTDVIHNPFFNFFLTGTN